MLPHLLPFLNGVEKKLVPIFFWFLSLYLFKDWGKIQNKQLLFFSLTTVISEERNHLKEESGQLKALVEGLESMC